MSVRSAQSITVLFTTRVFATGVGTNADSLPTGTLYVNGTADAASVTVTNLATGIYKSAVTLPTLAVGDVVDLRIAATVSTIADSAVIWRDTKDVLLTSTGGTAIDWANVQNPTTTLALTGTTVATTQKVDLETIKTNPVVNAGTVTFPTTATLASTTNITAGTITTVTTTTTATNVTTVNGLAAGVITAASIADNAIDTATFAAGTTIPRVTLADTVTTYTGNTPQTGDAYALANSGTFGLAAIKGYVDDIGVAGAGLTALGDTRLGNLDAAVSSRMATYTQPTGFLAATFPATIASTTNITAGTITTVTTTTTATNLTNAPTAGDFTTAMKTSLNAATPASVTGSVGSVTGTVGGMTASGWATAFTTDTTKAFADAVEGSLVKEVADGVASGGGTVDANIVSVNGTTFVGSNVPASLTGVTFPSNFSALGITAGGKLSGVVLADTVTTLTNLPTMPTDWVTAAGLSAAAVTEIQTGLSTYSGGDTAGTTTLLSRVTGTVALGSDLATVAGYVDTEVAAIKAKTDNLPASPAAVGSAMTLANGAITEASIAQPTEAAGRPTGLLAKLQRLFEWAGNKRTRNKTTGVVTLRNSGDTGDLETQTQSTVEPVDTQSKGV